MLKERSVLNQNKVISLIIFSILYAVPIFLLNWLVIFFDYHVS